MVDIAICYGAETVESSWEDNVGCRFLYIIWEVLGMHLSLLCFFNREVT